MDYYSAIQRGRIPLVRLIHKVITSVLKVGQLPFEVQRSSTALITDRSLLEWYGHKIFSENFYWKFSYETIFGLKN